MNNFFNDLATMQPISTTEGKPWKEVFVVSDVTRNVRVHAYADNLAFGFGETRGMPTWPLNEDWQKNFSWRKKKFYIGKHVFYGPEGFVQEFVSYRNDLEKLIGVYQPRTVYISGRSQGGAHGLYLYSWLVVEHPEIEVFGMGIAMPQALDARSQMLLELHEKPRFRKASWKRLYTTGDPISVSPLWLLGYTHHGPASFIGHWGWRLWPFDPWRHADLTYRRELAKLD